MKSILQEEVLVLNRGWQAIDTTDVATALCDLFRGVATAIDTGNEDSGMQAVTLEEWLTLPIRPARPGHAADKWIGTVRSKVRVPTVIVKASYSDIPKRRPKLDNRGIRDRDRCRCQVTGDLCPDGSVDHLVPRSRGGAKKSWTNMVWMRRDLNGKKGDRTLEEMGWKLRRPPKEPMAVPVSITIRRREDKPDWNHFLIH
jgi:5-methylcytosine-specific restriction endonuclease McrA